MAIILNLKLEVNNIPLPILGEYRSPTSDLIEFLTTIVNILKVENNNYNICMLFGDIKYEYKYCRHYSTNEYLDI